MTNLPFFIDKRVVQRELTKLSHAVRDGIKYVMGNPIGAMTAHGLGMHNPENGVDCTPDPDCPTCRREGKA